MIAHADPTLKTRLLQFVPLNALTEDHLATLLRESAVEVICRGQRLLAAGDYDNHYVYLLSGRVAVANPGGPRHLAAHDPEARFPLAHRQPRRQTVTALEDCEVVRFDCDLLDAMLAWDQAASYIALDIASRRDLDEDADWMLTLLRSNLFYKVPPMNIRAILDRFRPLFAHAGEVIVRQGEMGDCCYFVKEGSVAVHRSPDGRHLGEAVAELGPGRCFGEDALVDDRPRNATVVMRENGVLMVLDKSDFYLLLKSPPVRTLSLAEVERELAAGAGLVDVRSQEEFERAHARGALNMPLSILKLKSRLLDPARTYVVYCNSGRRSLATAHLLGEEGFRIITLRHGIDSLDAATRLRFAGEGDAPHLAEERLLAGTEEIAAGSMAS